VGFDTCGSNSGWHTESRLIVGQEENVTQKMMKIAGLMMLGIGAASSCWATVVPEIDASTGVNAIALVAGALLIVRSRR